MRISGLVCCAFASAPLAAQFDARLDLSSSTRYVWHGLSRAGGIGLHPSAAAGFRFGAFTLATGLVRHYEWDRQGQGTGRVGEDNVWAQGGFDHGRFRFRSGVVRYVFRDPLRNTTELYAVAGATSRYLNPSLEAWWDVGRVHGGFLRATASSPVIGWPLEPYFFLALTGDVGVNLGQAPNPARPNDLANFAGRGVTHAGFGVNLVRRLRHWSGLGSASLELGLNSQLNLDEATRDDGIARRRNLITWFSAGITVLLGGEARVLR